jgi:hypothetical protein
MSPPVVECIKPGRAVGNGCRCTRRPNIWHAEFITSGFGGTSIANDASSKGSLPFVFRILTCSGSCPELLLQRSPPWSFATAAWSGLGPAPESRSRGASPHLSRSFTTIPVVDLLSFCLCSTPSTPAARRLTNRRRRTRSESCAPSPSNMAGASSMCSMTGSAATSRARIGPP